MVHPEEARTRGRVRTPVEQPNMAAVAKRRGQAGSMPCIRRRVPTATDRFPAGCGLRPDRGDGLCQIAGACVEARGTLRAGDAVARRNGTCRNPSGACSDRSSEVPMPSNSHPKN